MAPKPYADKGDPLAAWLGCIRSQNNGIAAFPDLSGIDNGRVAVTLKPKIIDIRDKLPIVLGITADPFEPVEDVVLKKGVEVPASGLTQVYKLPAGISATALSGGFVLTFNTTRGTDTVQVNFGAPPGH